jgi:hypothetical protein
MMLGISTSGLQLAMRAGLAAGLSIAIAQFFKLEYPIYAFIAAVIVTDLSPAQSRRLGFIRIVATVVGALLGAAERRSSSRSRDGRREYCACHAGLPSDPRARERQGRGLYMRPSRVRPRQRALPLRLLPAHRDGARGSRGLGDQLRAEADPRRAAGELKLK